MMPLGLNRVIAPHHLGVLVACLGLGEDNDFKFTL
jgi:hypothetical protein